MVEEVNVGSLAPVLLCEPFFNEFGVVASSVSPRLLTLV